MRGRKKTIGKRVGPKRIRRSRYCANCRALLEDPLKEQKRIDDIIRRDIVRAKQQAARAKELHDD